MTGFIAGSAVLLILVIVVLLRPLLRRTPAEASVARAQINAGIYRNQLDELEVDRDNGILDPAVYGQSRLELERRALEDINDDATAAPKALRWPAISLVVIAPLAAILTYFALGSPSALQPRDDDHGMTTERINRMVDDLAQRLEKNPDDQKGWVMLGRSYKTMGRLPEAIKAFERAGDAIDADPQNLIDFAEALALADRENFQQRGTKLIERSLKLYPDHMPSLVFAGSAAYERADYRNASAYWQKALALLPAESDEAKAVREAISRADAAGGKGNASNKSAGSKPVAANTEKSRPATAASDTGISGQVSLAPALAAKASPDDTLFVFARAAEGPRAPLAVVRAKVRDLPMKFTLNDAQAMSPDLRISLFSKIRVEARISRSGNAAPQPGDLQGASGIVAATASDLKVVIDQLVP